MSKLKKYLTKSELDSLKGMQKSLKENNMAITCIGLYNHGKSTLLNVLINDLEMKTFKTADARETTSNKSIVHKNIKYVDTPGLNAQDDDDEKVMDAIHTSDITLFVHAITTGEFNKKEVDFLNKIKKHWKDSKEFIERTIFILSRIDNIKYYEDIEKTQHKMKEQIRNIFQSNSVIVPVSSNDYIEGMVHNEGELITESNINDLKSQINTIAQQSKKAIMNTKRERFEKKYWSLYQKLNVNIKVNEQKILGLKQKQKDIDKAFRVDIGKIEDKLKRMYGSL